LSRKCVVEHEPVHASLASLAVIGAYGDLVGLALPTPLDGYEALVREQVLRRDLLLGESARLAIAYTMGLIGRAFKVLAGCGKDVGGAAARVLDDSEVATNGLVTQGPSWPCCGELGAHMDFLCGCTLHDKVWPSLTLTQRTTYDFGAGVLAWPAGSLKLYALEVAGVPCCAPQDARCQPWSGRGYRLGGIGKRVVRVAEVNGGFRELEVDWILETSWLRACVKCDVVPWRSARIQAPRRLTLLAKGSQQIPRVV
jgi:hypothetical protein